MKLLFICALGLSSFALNAMQVSPDTLLPQSPREVARMNSFKMKQLERLKAAIPDLNSKLAMAALRKNAKKEYKSQTQEYSYVGPQVFDIISSNCSVTQNRFALADQDESAADIYQAQSPFAKTMNLPAQAIPFGINAIAANNQDQVAMDSGNSIIIWDIEEKEQFTLKGHIDTVTSVDFNPNNPNMLVSGSYDNTIKLWDLRTSRQAVKTFPTNNKVYSVAFSPTQDELVSVNAANSYALELWAIKNSKVIASNSGSWTAKYNHAGNAIIAGLPGKIMLYDAQNLQVIRSLELPDNWSKNNAIPGSFDFSEGDKQVVVSGPLQDIFIFNANLSNIPVDIQSGMLGVDSHWIGENILSSAYGCAFDGGPYVRIWNPFQIRKKIQENLDRERNDTLNMLVKDTDNKNERCSIN
jgi:hypothetical protein